MVQHLSHIQNLVTPEICYNTRSLRGVGFSARREWVGLRNLLTSTSLHKVYRPPFGGLLLPRPGLVNSLIRLPSIISV